LAAAVVFTLAFAALFLTAEMLMQVAALMLIGIDGLIDALVTDRGLAKLFARAADLFGRPVLAEQRVNLLPSGRSNAGGVVFGFTARVRKLLGLFGAVAALTPIAFEFARDGARNNPSSRAMRD